MRSPVKLASLGAAIASAAAWISGAAAGVMLLGACASCDSIVRQTSLPALAAANMDGVEVDQGGHRVFYTDQATHTIQIVDISSSSPRLAGTMSVPAAPSGLAYAADRQRLYVGLDGGVVGVIDTDPVSAKYGQVIDKVTVDKAQADLLDYSAQTGTVYVGTALSNAVVTFDANSDKVTTRYDVKAPVEQPRFDPADGKIYVTTPATDSLVQIDPATGQVTRSYVIPKCRPAGLAINPNRQLAVAACRGSTALYNLRTGGTEVSRTVPGGDLVSYDARADRFLVGSSHGPRDSSVGVFDGDGQFVAQVQSSPNAHGAVINDSTGVVYAASAVGLLSFTPAACAPPPEWLSFAGGMSVYLTPLIAFGLFLFLYARRRSRRDPNAPRSSTWEQLQAEDLEAERERIRALEDAIYGPQPEA
jgi:hypothetical protein